MNSDGALQQARPARADIARARSLGYYPSRPQVPDVGRDAAAPARGSCTPCGDPVRSHGVDSLGSSGVTATVYWADDAGPHDDELARPVLTGDIRRRHIVVDDSAPGETPVLLEYDDNDRFNVSGDPVSLTVFQSVLADELKLEDPDAELEWSGYRPGNTSRVTEYNLIP